MLAVQIRFALDPVSLTSVETLACKECRTLFFSALSLIHRNLLCGEKALSNFWCTFNDFCLGPNGGVAVSRTLARLMDVFFAWSVWRHF
jgi:hypothetical protein